VAHDQPRPIGAAVPGEAGYQDGYQLAGYDYQRVRM
jgi:hypothetical protein